MAEKQWIDWPHDECPECGGSVEIETDCPQDAAAVAKFSDSEEVVGEPPFVWCGDKWRCEDGHTGSVYADSETPVKLELPFNG